MKGTFIAVTGPSASGKTAIVVEMIKRIPGATRLITFTTRPPRPQEVNGRDYFFIDRQAFQKMIEGGELFEYAEVYGNWYGLSHAVLHKTLEQSPCVFVIIDVQGAKNLKTKIPEARVIFLYPNDTDDLERRLREERTETSEEEIEKRIAKARYELSLADTFDAVVYNKEGELEQTVEKALACVTRFSHGV
jgi:guanylate kinase